MEHSDNSFAGRAAAVVLKTQPGCIPLRWRAGNEYQAAGVDLPIIRNRPFDILASFGIVHSTGQLHEVV